VAVSIRRPDDGGGATPADHPAEAAARRRRVILFSTIAALGGFLFGYDTSVINGAVGAVQAHYQAGPLALGAAVASALVGSAVGAWFAGQIADRIGRVRTMLIAAALFVIGSLGTGIAVTLYDFAAWRILGGVAVGIASVIAPAYIAEIAPARQRGRLGSLQQLAIVFGIAVSLFADFAIASIAGSAQNTLVFGAPAWRVMFWIEVIPAILYGLLVLQLSESPRYLVQRGRDVEAGIVLRELQGGDVMAKVADIRQTVKTEAHPRLRDLVDRRFGLLPIVWIGIGLSAFQQLVGINVIFYYSSVLWSAVGFSQQNALLITVITSVVNIVTTFIAIALVDHVGRKPLMLVGSVGMALTLGTLAIVFGTAPLSAAGQPQLIGSAGPVALIAANLYVVSFGFSWGPVVWVLLGEMFPNSIRAIAISVAASAQWIANFAVSTTFPSLQHLGLGLAYGLYTTAAVLSFFFIWTLLRETKGKELERM
jgi:MFS transporter, SP family, sugar:H+ symporter